MEDNTNHARVEFYLDAQGQYRWRWRRIARNGNILAVSSESYHNEDDAQAAMYSACASLDGVHIVSLGQEEGTS